MKIVINRCFGGFGLSDDAVELYARLKCIDLGPRNCSDFGGTYWYINNVETEENYFSSFTIIEQTTRADTTLVQVVEELGTAANGRFAELKVVEIPDGVEWEIDEYDGMEHVAEQHRTWS